MHKNLIYVWKSVILISYLDIYVVYLKPNNQALQIISKTSGIKMPKKLFGRPADGYQTVIGRHSTAAARVAGGRRPRVASATLR